MNIEGKWKTREIFVNGKYLSPSNSQKVWSHSPDGFNWGYGGSGPAQLALALLLLATDKETAIRLHQKLKFEFIAKIAQSNFYTSFDIEGWIKKQTTKER